jgi:ribosomal protein L29
MTYEEVKAALPKLRQEAAEARVDAAMERLARTAEVATYVEVRKEPLGVNTRARETNAKGKQSE